MTAKVYTTAPGHEVWIAGYGPATNDVPALVPEHVGVELADVPGLNVEFHVQFEGEAESPEPEPELAHEADDAMEAEEPAFWHAAAGSVYHDQPGCSLGNNIEPENRRPGTGGRPLCRECAKLKAREE